MSAKKTATKKTSTEKDVCEQKPALIPFRSKVAELATQLVAAQIGASASYQAAVDVVKEQRELVAECFEMLSQLMKPAPESELRLNADSTILAQVSKRLRYSRGQVRKPRELLPLSKPELDLLFGSAMYRAQKMLGSPEQDQRTVWAEQLFEPDESLPEDRIFRRFHQYQWPDLASRPSVVALMTSVDNWFSAHYRCLDRVESDESQDHEANQMRDEDRILEQALQISEGRARDDNSRNRRDYTAIADAIKALLNAGNERILSQLSGAIGRNQARNLIFMLFNQSHPKPREKVDPVPKVRKLIRIYRPWGVFRYLRLHAGKAGDEEGAAINSKIQRPFSKLNPDLFVNVLPVCPPEFQFGPIDIEMNDILDSPEYDAGDSEMPYAEGSEHSGDDLPL